LSSFAYQTLTPDYPGKDSHAILINALMYAFLKAKRFAWKAGVFLN
jgi:hypothetical protein